jgi:hypothetical protein
MHDINSAESVPCDPASQPFSQQLFDEIKIVLITATGSTGAEPGALACLTALC